MANTIKLCDDFEIDAALFMDEGFQISILGKSGAGKTNTELVFVSEWQSLNLPFVVIDPMGAFQKYLTNMIVAGSEERSEFPLSVGNAGAFAKLIYTERLSAIVDTSDFTPQETEAITAEFLKGLWGAVLPQHDPVTFALIIDEASTLIPQQGTTLSSETLRDIAKRGRQRGLTVVAATQRTAHIDKDFLTQARVVIAHRVMFANDVSFVKNIVPLKEQEILTTMRRFKRGEAFVVGDAEFIGEDDDYLRIRVQKSELDATVNDSTKKTVMSSGQVDDRIREALKSLAKVQTSSAEKPELVQLRQEVESLREQLADMEKSLDDQAETYQLEIDRKDKTIEQLQTQVQILGAIKVTVDQPVSPNSAQIKTVSIKDIEAKQMKVEKIIGAEHVHQPALLPSTVVSTPVAEPDTAPKLEVDIEARAEYRSERAEKIAINRQRRRFEKLAKDIRDLPIATQKSLGYLIEKPNEAFDLNSIARATGLSKSTLRLAPLQALCVVKREVKSRGYVVYRSTVRQYLTEEFPDLGTEDLIGELLEKLPV